MPALAGDFYSSHSISSKSHYKYQVAPVKSTLDMSGISRELPMPVVTRIASLAQAQATLQHCLTRLSRSWHGSPLTAHERRNFQQWLEQWEQAFTTYLSFAMSTMKAEEITCCRVLKANHLACTVLASEGGSSGFEADFQAIVELAAVILRSRRQGSLGPSDLGNGALDVRDPLRIVAARCDHPKIRAQAAELLSVIVGR